MTEFVQESTATIISAIKQLFSHYCVTVFKDKSLGGTVGTWKMSTLRFSLTCRWPPGDRFVFSSLDIIKKDMSKTSHSNTSMQSILIFPSLETCDNYERDRSVKQ